MERPARRHVSLASREPRRWRGAWGVPGWEAKGVPPSARARVVCGQVGARRLVQDMSGLVGLHILVAIRKNLQAPAGSLEGLADLLA